MNARPDDLKMGPIRRVNVMEDSVSLMLENIDKIIAICEEKTRRAVNEAAEAAVRHDRELANQAQTWRERLNAERRRSGKMMAAMGLISFAIGALLATAAWWGLR